MKFFKLRFILLLNVLTISFGTELVEKAAHLANSVFKESSVIIWINNSDHVIQFIKLYEGGVMLTPVQNNSNEIIRKFNKDSRYKQTVLFANKIEEIKYVLTLLNKDFVKPIQLIVVLNKLTVNSELSDIMAIAWKNDVADILILSLSDEKVLLTTYFPYNNGRCGDSTPIYLDQHMKNLFPKKFRNFQGCEIRASLLPTPLISKANIKNGKVVSLSGIDGSVIDTLFKVLNATTPNKRTESGSLVNGTATGFFGDLVAKNSDLISPMLIMSHTRYPYVQWAHTYRSYSIHWIGPKRRQISEWLRALQPFMSDITPLFFFSSCIYVIVAICVRRLKLRRPFNDSVIFQSFVIFLGQEVNFLTTSWLLNSLFVLWIWFCMIVRIAYQGDMVQNLQNTVLESPLGNFKEAIKKVDGYGGIDVFKDFYKGTPYYDNYKVVEFEKIYENMLAIVAGKRLLIAADILLVMEVALDIQILSSDPVTVSPACLHMRPGWPAAADVDKVLLHMTEVGLTQKVLGEHAWKRHRLTAGRNSEPESKPLTMENLIEIFYGLAFMYAVCIIVLIIEIIYHKYKLRKEHFKQNFNGIN